jgi:glucose uptake protein
MGWRAFWLPIAGGVVWAAGSTFAFRASQLIGLARAGGSWTPLNIVIAFVWGAALFGQLSGLPVGRRALLGAGVALVAAGLLVVVRSQEAGVPGASGSGSGGGGGSRAGGEAAGAAGAERAGRRYTAQLAAGVLFGAGNLALLALVARVGTGAGFTIAQLSLVLNAAIGIWVFKVPLPGSRAAHRVLTGVVIAGTGGCLIGLLHESTSRRSGPRAARRRLLARSGRDRET